IRVFDLMDIATDNGPAVGVQQQVYRMIKGSKSKDPWQPYGPPRVPMRRGEPVPFIPFVPMNAGSLGIEPDDPPFLGICEINLSQYRTSADLENARWKMGHPQLAAFGVTTNTELEIGAGIWVCENPQGHVDVVQVQDQLGGLERAMTEK